MPSHGQDPGHDQTRKDPREDVPGPLPPAPRAEGCIRPVIPRPGIEATEHHAHEATEHEEHEQCRQKQRVHHWRQPGHPPEHGQTETDDEPPGNIHGRPSSL